jgi:hypothetical protein
VSLKIRGASSIPNPQQQAYPHPARTANKTPPVGARKIIRSDKLSPDWGRVVHAGGPWDRMRRDFIDQMIEQQNSQTS